MQKQLLFIGFACASLAWAAELPVREVILYKSGVGYFSRAGELAPGEGAKLDFKASDMNDVLKSLTIEDRGGGKVTGVHYDSAEPVEHRLAGFPFKLGAQEALAAFLDQMKGARIELKLGSETADGVILSARVVAADEKKPERQEVVLLAGGGDIRSFDLAAVAAIRFADPSLQTMLRDYLAVMSQSRSRDKRSVYIDSTDKGARTLIASYMLPVPVWKSSYRLIFGVQADATLEGWAIIDNTSGEDWTNVKLAVVSGRPVSFITDLYQPLYLQRPTVELPEQQALAPVIHEGAVSVGSLAAPAPPPMAAGKAGRVLPQTFASAAAERVEVARDEMTSSIASTAEGQELGELFEYRFGGAVTVKKNESTMLPFVQQKIEARKLLIYRDGSGQNPLAAAELTNNTGKTLDGGPITVFDAGAYAGEALAETVKSGDKRLISYAVDLGTRVTTAFDSSNEVVREAHFRRGVLTTRYAVQETRTYTIHNVDAKAKTLIIEHPVRPGYKLLNQKPAETTASAYRFEVKLAPSSTEKYPVIEERVYNTTTLVTSMTPDALGAFVQNKALSDEARQQLGRILQLKRQIADNDTAAKRLDSDINGVVRDQDRIRQNIDSLNRVSGQQEQVQRYSRDLAAQESKLAAMRDQVSDLRHKAAALQSELNSLIDKMEF